MRIRKILVDVSAIMDLRLGCLNLISTDFAKEMMAGDWYFTRNVDAFKSPTMGVLSSDNYKAVMSKHGDSVLYTSVPTKIHILLKLLAQFYLRRASTTPWLDSLEFDLNVYPFKPTEQQLALYRHWFKKMVSPVVNMNVVSLSPTAVNCDKVTSEYLNLVFYNPTEWFDANLDGIKRHVLSNVGLFMPELQFGGEIPEAEMKTLLARGMRPADVVTQILSQTIKMRYLPVAFFCADIPSNKNEYFGSLSLEE